MRDLDGTDHSPPALRRLLIDDLRSDMGSFRWDFRTFGNNCGTHGCAFARAQRLGIVGKRGYDPAQQLIDALALPGSAIPIFSSPSWYSYDGCWEAVTPQMVADALEHLCNQIEAKEVHNAF